VRAHAGPLLLFLALTIGWSRPLVLHLRDAVPGEGGDNYSFLWNLWWMRHVLSAHEPGYFRTTHLFYPFGTTIADHPHTALPALVAATVLRPLSVIAAQNVLLLACLFANLACGYALVWDATRHRRAAVLGGVVFGTSPYLAAHLLGHFDLVSAWVLPLFALCLRRALATGSPRAAAGAGATIAAAAYIAYYYVVYLALLAALYVTAWLDPLGVALPPRPQTAGARRMRAFAAVAILAFGGVAFWIGATGGGDVQLGSILISARTPQNALAAVWIAAAAYGLTWRRPSIARRRVALDRSRRTLRVVVWIAAIFAVATAPLLWEAAGLVMRGEYVTPAYMWRSAPRGVDLMAPLLGPPSHPLVRNQVQRAYAGLHLDRIEGVGWTGIVPAVLLIAAWRRPAHEEARRWRVVAGGFLLWALGPFLTIAGRDTGLKLPETLVRYVPFAANARMPGRAMVGVYLAGAVLIGIEMARAAGTGRGALARPAVQWLLVGLLVFEYWDAPVRLTPLDVPPVYQRLATLAPGAVCEVPLGIGDGLSGGVGSQERRILFYATIHEHPLVGGYIGRMPRDAADRYERMEVAGDLLRLSDGRPARSTPPSDTGPCDYIVVMREATTPAIREYLNRLALERVASDENRDLYASQRRGSITAP